MTQNDQHDSTLAPPTGDDTAIAERPPDDAPFEGALFEDELPVRPRRRLVTPVTVTLGTILVLALGFVAGVQVQKRQGGSTSNAGAPSGFPGAPGAANGSRGSGTGAATGTGGAASATAPTFGTVANKKGSTLYVTTSEGATVRVRLDAQGKVTRTAASSAAAVHPGDTVIVQGTTTDDGTIKATQISATASGVSGVGGFPGGGPPGAAAEATGQGSAG